MAWRSNLSDKATCLNCQSRTFDTFFIRTSSTVVMQLWLTAVNGNAVSLRYTGSVEQADEITCRSCGPQSLGTPLPSFVVWDATSTGPLELCDNLFNDSAFDYIFSVCSSTSRWDTNNENSYSFRKMCTDGSLPSRTSFSTSFTWLWFAGWSCIPSRSSNDPYVQAV